VWTLGNGKINSTLPDLRTAVPLRMLVATSCGRAWKGSAERLDPKCARVRMPFRPHRADLLETMRKERTPTFLISLRKSYVTRDATTTIIQHRSSVANLDDDIQIGSAVSPSGGERGKWAVVSRLGQWQRCDCGRKFHVRYGFVHWRACADRWPLNCLHLCFASVSLDLQS